MLFFRFFITSSKMVQSQTGIKHVVFYSLGGQRQGHLGGRSRDQVFFNSSCCFYSGPFGSGCQRGGIWGFLKNGGQGKFDRLGGGIGVSNKTWNDPRAFLVSQHGRKLELNQPSNLIDMTKNCAFKPNKFFTVQGYPP